MSAIRRARAALKDARRHLNEAVASDHSAGETEDEDMAHPIQRARQALRNAELQAESAEDVDGDIEAGLGEAVPPASGTEADLPPMHQRIHDMTSSGQIGKGNNSSRPRTAARPRGAPARKDSFEGHVGLLSRPNSFQKHDGPTEQTPLLREMQDESRSRRESMQHQARWRKSVRSVIAVNSMRGGKAPSVASHDGGQEETEEPRPGWIAPRSDAKAVLRLFTSSWMNVLLLSVPFGWLAYFLHWNAIAIFVLNFVALIPLALVLGEVTEDLATRFGDVIGGLLNATFGNVVELILSVAALTKGLYTVVAMSLIGSILSNLLLVMGFCFLCGGTRYLTQSFNLMVNKACCSLLMIASVAIVIPTSARALYGEDRVDHQTLANVSHAIAILLIILYGCYLLFQLKTHASFFKESTEDSTPALSLVAAMGTLTGITIIVAVSSEFLTGALEDVAKQSGLGEEFLGLIVLPIAGNACEHITAVFVAVKDKMDLAIGVALGSSIQIAIFVLPVMVLVGWAIGKPFLLDLEPFAALVLTLSVIHTYFVSSDGNSNWLMGAELIATYLLIALLYLFMHDPKDSNSAALSLAKAVAA